MYSRNVVTNFSNKFQLVQMKSNERKVDFTNSLSNVGSNLTPNHFDFIRAKAHTHTCAYNYIHIYIYTIYTLYSSKALPNAQVKRRQVFGQVEQYLRPVCIRLNDAFIDRQHSRDMYLRYQLVPRVYVQF